MAVALALGGSVELRASSTPLFSRFLPFALLWPCLACARSSLAKPCEDATAIVACCSATINTLGSDIRNISVFDPGSCLSTEFYPGTGAREFRKEVDPMLPRGSGTLTADEGQMSAFYNQKALSLVLKNPARFPPSGRHRAVNYWFKMDTPRPSDKVVGILAYYPVLFWGVRISGSPGGITMRNC